MSVIETINEIKKIAKQNQEREEGKKVKRVKGLSVGECYRQGDIYVFKVSDNHPVGDELKRDQIADGVSLGARHRLLGGKFKIYAGKQAPNFVRDLNARVGLGYAFDVCEHGVINDHPEHDNYVFEQTGRFQVIHQVDLRTLQRVAD